MPNEDSAAQTATSADGAPSRHSDGHLRQSAAHRAVHETSTTVTLPVFGHVTLPPPEHLAWYGAVATLAALEIIEWPIAAVLAVGKMLADSRHNAALEEFGKALDDEV